MMKLLLAIMVCLIFVSGNVFAQKKNVTIKTIFSPNRFDDKLILESFSSNAQGNSSVGRLLAHELGHTVGVKNYFASPEELMFAFTNEDEGQGISGTEITLNQAIESRSE